MEYIDHMFYVKLLVCIICIHGSHLGSPCKRHEVLTRTRCPDSQARKSWLGQEIWTTKQEVMARIGNVRIAMHWKLPRGMSALDKELATLLVGPDVWLDINSNRECCMGYALDLVEFLIFQRCWFGMDSNIWWLRIIEGFCIFQ